MWLELNNDKRRLLLLLSTTTLLGLGLLIATVRYGPEILGRRMFYPDPPPLPVEVSTSTADLLKQLENELQAQAPQGLAELNPGLSLETISEIERQNGFTLPPDIKALYQWRNGQPSGSTNQIVPGHYFVPLQDAVKINQATQPKGALTSFFIGHQKSWLPVFDDGASDGYFLDVAKSAKPGCFFYHMAEDSHYLFFTSFRNFLTGLNECYAKGLIKYDPAEQSLMEDYLLSQAVWIKYGTYKNL